MPSGSWYCDKHVLEKSFCELIDRLPTPPVGDLLNLVVQDDSGCRPQLCSISSGVTSALYIWNDILQCVVLARYTPFAFCPLRAAAGMLLPVNLAPLFVALKYRRRLQRRRWWRRYTYSVPDPFYSPRSIGVARIFSGGALFFPRKRYREELRGG